ncbi:acetamidase/formamidase family protein [Brevibacillus porteri]|uniref:Acetamidase n=1 Tax=Brevibacillus porteri TaxID=2126350 RepID=A0ABX5FMQ6_9BACL|nr:acetamidase/formamidase family protein [Brevibacillus porteri]MED1801495.1 acetamidase/formamidase family protein [Brevibacillus porteri]MED2133802.1 acetamidase/formamidase family protein [Brevibacillus porteri]MED2748208.1 acetamidase/formamidase family protein [Brevibacillus porteri]MED2815346.1 acetamidase/formamidase family protein [Brevibacillus porteri]MED2894847.1 acetamidase/formamidase family protein [Brevibacillus porteri]
MYRVKKQDVIYAMSPENQPVLKVEAGSIVTVETCDCFEDQIQSADTVFQELDWNRINPASGPIYIEGTEPGDILVVNIQKIEIKNQGVMVTGPELGVMGFDLQENVIKMIPIQDGQAVLSDKLQVPINPMIGVIGTAPAKEAISCGTPGDHGGNMDCKQMREGTTLLLPVNVPGALFALGDLHAAMADGEVAVCGVEIAGEVTVKLDVIKGKQWPLPMAVNQEHLITIASEKELDKAADRAVINMVQFLHEELGVEKAEATFLLSAAGDLRICQVVDPLKTARMELPLAYATALGFDSKIVGR